MTDANSDLAHSERWSYLKLSGHIAQKGWQLGSAIACAVAPTVFYLKSRDGPQEEGIQKALQAGGYSGLAGIGFAGTIGAYKMATEPRDAIEERVYRLHFNTSQQRADRFCQVGAAAGVAAALYRNERDVLPVIGYAAAGTAVGLLAHAITAPRAADPEAAAKSVKNKTEAAARGVRDSAR